MSYLITGIVFSIVTWWIVKEDCFFELHRQKEINIKLLEKNTALLKQIEELESEIVVIKSMRGE